MVDLILSRSLRWIGCNIVAVLCLSHTVSGQAQLFGWFDNPQGNTGDRSGQIQQTARHANLTMSVQYWHAAEWEAAAAAGQRVVLMIPDELVWQVDTSLPVSADLAMWCREACWCGKTWADWVALIDSHREQVAAILIADEKDCNDGGIRYPSWTPDSCRRAATKVLALHEAVKAALPWVKTWVNYTSAYAFYYRLAQVYGRHPSVYGVSLPPADWISMDCYTPYASCFGRDSVETMYGSLKPWLQSHQRFVLLPRAFSGSFLGWNPTHAELATMAGQYLAFAQRETRVEAVMPFIWRSVPGVGWGARDVPDLAATYVSMGQQITGRRLAAPLGVRIVREP